MNFKPIFLIIMLLLVAGIGAYAVLMFTGNRMIALPGNQNQPPGNNNQIDADPGLPARLVIPSINVNANVIQVGLTAGGAVDTPKGPYEVAWYKLGPRPGTEGSAVITGHYGPWQTGANSVFDNLHKLKKGDKVYVRDNAGKEFAFVVRESRIYGPNDTAPEVFNSSSGAHLNLITCSGQWLQNQRTYTQRLVVFADAV